MRMISRLPQSEITPYSEGSCRNTSLSCPKDVRHLARNAAGPNLHPPGPVEGCNLEPCPDVPVADGTGKGSGWSTSGQRFRWNDAFDATKRTRLVRVGPEPHQIIHRQCGRTGPAIRKNPITLLNRFAFPPGRCRLQ